MIIIVIMIIKLMNPKTREVFSFKGKLFGRLQGKRQQQLLPKRQIALKFSEQVPIILQYKCVGTREHNFKYKYETQKKICTIEMTLNFTCRFRSSVIREI